MRIYSGRWGMYEICAMEPRQQWMFLPKTSSAVATTNEYAPPGWWLNCGTQQWYHPRCINHCLARRNEWGSTVHATMFNKSSWYNKTQRWYDHQWIHQGGTQWWYHCWCIHQHSPRRNEWGSTIRTTTFPESRWYKKKQRWCDCQWIHQRSARRINCYSSNSSQILQFSIVKMNFQILILQE